jgi:hypothetical protein
VIGRRGGEGKGGEGGEGRKEGDLHCRQHSRRDRGGDSRELRGRLRHKVVRVRRRHSNHRSIRSSLRQTSQSCSSLSNKLFLHLFILNNTSLELRRRNLLEDSLENGNLNLSQGIRNPVWRRSCTGSLCANSGLSDLRRISGFGDCEQILGDGLYTQGVRHQSRFAKGD